MSEASPLKDREHQQVEDPRYVAGKVDIGKEGFICVTLDDADQGIQGVMRYEGL